MEMSESLPCRSLECSGGIISEAGCENHGRGVDNGNDEQDPFIVLWNEGKNCENDAEYDPGE